MFKDIYHIFPILRHWDARWFSCSFLKFIFDRFCWRCWYCCWHYNLNNLASRERYFSYNLPNFFLLSTTEPPERKIGEWQFWAHPAATRCVPFDAFFFSSLLCSLQNGAYVCVCVCVLCVVCEERTNCHHCSYRHAKCIACIDVLWKGVSMNPYLQFLKKIIAFCPCTYIFWRWNVIYI